MTFSKFKKSEVKKELLKCLLSGNIEQSCYWSAELICSGDFLYLWNTLFFFTSKYIHIGNPKLPLYIDSRLNIFKNIVNQGYSTDILKLRNNSNIRKLFIEVGYYGDFGDELNAANLYEIEITNDEIETSLKSTKINDDHFYYKHLSLSIHSIIGFDPFY